MRNAKKDTYEFFLIYHHFDIAKFYREKYKINYWKFSKKQANIAATIVRPMLLWNEPIADINELFTQKTKLEEL